MPTVKNEPAPSPVTAVADVRRVPLGRLAASPAVALERVVPAADAPRVPVAAFNSSI